jgi:hypothetical protein
VCPPYGSTDHGSDQAITLADGSGQDEPFIPLAIGGAGGVQDTLALHVHHNGVNGAFVAARVQSHAPHDVGAGLGPLLDQGAADGGAGESGEVHRGGVVN